MKGPPLVRTLRSVDGPMGLAPSDPLENGMCICGSLGHATLRFVYALDANAHLLADGCPLVTDRFGHDDREMPFEMVKTRRSEAIKVESAAFASVTARHHRQREGCS